MKLRTGTFLWKRWAEFRQFSCHSNFARSQQRLFLPLTCGGAGLWRRANLTYADFALTGPAFTIAPARMVTILEAFTITLGSLLLCRAFQRRKRLLLSSADKSS